MRPGIDTLIAFTRKDKAFALLSRASEAADEAATASRAGRPRTTAAPAPATSAGEFRDANRMLMVDGCDVYRYFVSKGSHLGSKDRAGNRAFNTCNFPAIFLKH